MKEILLKLLHLYQMQKRQWYWKKEMHALLAATEHTSTKPSLPKGKYVVLIPHSDDEWIGNSTLISDSDYEVVLYNMNRQGGDSAELHAKRLGEMKNMAKSYGRELRTYYNDNDLSQFLMRYKPDCVLLPCFIDWHEEHIEVIDIFLQISKANNIDNLFVGMYQVTVPFKLANITHVNPMPQTQWKSKWNKFRVSYKTQPNFPWYRVACNERIQGSLFNCYAAEVYTVQPIKQWQTMYDNNRLSKDKMNEIKNRLHSLKDIRQIEMPSL